MHYSVSKLLVAGFVVCGQDSTTSSTLPVTTLISVPTSSYSSKSFSTIIYLTSTLSFGVSFMSTTASRGVSSGTYTSNRTPTSGTISSVISPITSFTSGSTLHTFTAFSLSHSGISHSQIFELGSILSNGYRSDSNFSSVSPATDFPSDTSILSSVSSSDPTTSTTSSTSSTTSCSATPSNTNPCPELQLVGNDPEPLEEDKPITDEKVAECENWLESNAEPPEGPTDSPEYKAWDQMRDRCSRIENVDKNVAIRKEYILQQSSAFRYECVQEAVAWLNVSL